MKPNPKPKLYYAYGRLADPRTPLLNRSFKKEQLAVQQITTWAQSHDTLKNLWVELPDGSRDVYNRLGNFVGNIKG